MRTVGVKSLLACAWICAAVIGSADAQMIEGYKFKHERGVERQIIALPRVAEAPEIDGRLADAAWATAFATERFTWGNGQPGENRTRLLMAYDGGHLYVGVQCFVKDVNRLKRLQPAGERDGNVWRDDCIDFKLSPDGGRTTFQFLVNANGCLYDQKGGNTRWNADCQCAAALGKDFYVVEMALPLTQIGVAEAKPGTGLLLSFNRADRTTGRLLALAEPYGELAKAPVIVLGTAAQYKALLVSGAFGREVALTLYLDRDQYPSFQRLATGRFRIASTRTAAKLVGNPTITLSVLKAGKEVRSQKIEPVESGVLDFDLGLAGLVPGTYELAAQVADAQGVLGTKKEEFVVLDRTAPRAGRIAITVPPAPADMHAWPVTFGVPFPWGALDSPDHVKMLDAAGNEVPIQVQVTGRWSRKGSIRWLLIDALPRVGAAGKYTLVYGPDVTRADPQGSVLSQDAEDAVVVSSGPIRLRVAKRPSPGGLDLWLDRNKNGEFDDRERLVRADPSAGPYLVDEPGTLYLGARDTQAEVVLEEAGPLKACVRVSGWHVSEEGDKLGKFIVRYHLYRGLPYVRMFHTFIITADSDKVRYRDIAYALPFRTYAYFFGTPVISQGRVRGQGAYLLQRDDQHFKVYDDGVFKQEGGKAEGWVTFGAPGAMATLALRDLWQQFPKELEVTPQRMTVHFWPAHGEEPIRTGKNLSIRNVYQQWFAHEGKVLNFKVSEEALEHVKHDTEKYNYPSAKVANAIGLAKTHEMMLYLHAEDWERARSRPMNRVFQSIPTATCDPKWVCDTKVFGNLHAKAPKQFPRVERALDDAIACIMRHRVMDRDYGMFNFGDSHHNWYWQERRWNLHRIWRNTHHGWTRWPWLMYARSGQKALFDWADRNARHVADVDHCHYATKDFIGLPWPRGKCVGGICDYKGFVHWASGARLGYNSAADPMIHHYYVTGDRRSLTAALEHGAALVAHGRAYPHREGSGRTTSACALYFLTWDNDYLEFLERTVACLLNTQREDGSFPQWENFAPYLQRHVDLTQSRRSMKAMAKWADWISSRAGGSRGYHSKINILAHAYLYTGDEKYLRTAAHRVNAFVDHVYRGPDPRYQGMFIAFHSNLDQSYFMQEVPYYLTALARLGHTPSPAEPVQTSIRALSREKIGGKTLYVFRARMRQDRDEPLQLAIRTSGYANVGYEATLRAPGQAEGVTAAVPPLEHRSGATIELAVPKDGDLEYELMVTALKNFHVTVPITHGQAGVKEVYPIFREGTWIGGGFKWYFGVPEGAKEFALRYQGRAWPLRFQVRDPGANVVAEDIWIGSNDLGGIRTLSRTLGNAPREGWTFSVVGYGQCNLLGFTTQPRLKGLPFYFGASREKLFTPAR